MVITIHRGINQIGGCITEIASASGTRILIDLGHNLPEGDKPSNDPLELSRNLDPIIEGVDAVFYTHSHGDHIGFEAQVAAKKIPQYIGPLSKELLILLRDNLLYGKEHNQSPELSKVRASREALPKFYTYAVNKPITIKDITITPYYVSHSAADSYMFLIECDKNKVLHTGDFRDHGYRGKGLIPTINRYIAHRKVDVLITEGTMLSNDDQRLISEDELSIKASTLMDEYKFVFVFCSSQDADRIVSLHRATYSKERRLLVDGYQYKVLKKFEDTLGKQPNSIYHFRNKLCYHKHWDWVLNRYIRYGFTMLIRNNYKMNKDIERIMAHVDPTKCCLIYSEFRGYITPNHSAFQKRTYDFVHSHDWHIEYLHTSGHASKEAIAEVCKHVNPQLAIIPIHREAGSDFLQLDIPQELKERVVISSTTINDLNIIIK